MKFIILLILFIFSLAWSSFHLSGHLDNRYIWSTETFSGTGTFKVNDFVLNYNFPVNKKYKVFVSHKINSSVSIEQLYLDTETMLPLQAKIGRIEIKTLHNENDQTKSFFISDSIFWSLTWGAGILLLPQYETGIELYSTGKDYSMSFFIVNGNSLWSEVNKDSAKSIGLFVKKSFNDFIKMQASYYSNIYETPGNDHSLLTSEIIIGNADIKVKGGFLLFFGENYNNQDSNIGLLSDIILRINKETYVSASASIFHKNQFFYKGLISLRANIDNDTIWKNEFAIEKNDTLLKREFIVQSQLLVKI
jgi:hypothetical protein